MKIENKNKPRVMWKFIKQLLPGKSKNASRGIMIEDKLVTDNKQIAQCFNEFFTNIGRQLAEKNPFQEFSDEYLPQNLDKSFKCPHITPEFVSKLLRKIPINKATGIDKISGKLLRYGEPVH